MTPEQKRAIELQAQGNTRAQIAAIMGISEHAVKRRLAGARKWQDADPAIGQTATNLGLNDVSRLSHYWDKVELDNGRKVSAFIKNDVAAVDVKNVLENVAEAFSGIPAFTAPVASKNNDDMLTVYPLYDMHIGMLAWGRETRGPDYDLDLMKSDLVSSIMEVAALSPPADKALIVLGGDTIHINDHFNETPASGHKMDADGRFEKIIDVAIEAITNAIELIADKHSEVSVVVLRGNHDETSHLVLKAALKQRYRNSDNVVFPKLDEWDKSEIYWFKHGKALIVLHHGDKAPPERLAMIAADKCPWWSETRYRVILTGHLHSLKVKDMPGCTHYTLRAFCPPDAYGAMYGGVRGLAAMTFSERKGLRVVSHDPIERD